MSEFTASNGMTVTIVGDESVQVQEEGYVGATMPRVTVALREFFMKENDDRLGRWRWPYVGNRNIVIYPHRGYPDRVLVLDETTGTAVYRNRGDDDERFKTAETEAAAAYFDAHPEPKPWHDAKPGEVWVLRISTGPTFDDVAMRVVGDPARFWPIDETDGDMTYGVRSEFITDGRCIWPEVQS